MSMSANTVICPSCGHKNPMWQTRCQQCGADLTSLTTPSSYMLERPGCVTAYALLNAIVGV
jgi:predicted amidophosphoribosyltransferase